LCGGEKTTYPRGTGSALVWRKETKSGEKERVDVHSRLAHQELHREQPKPKEGEKKDRSSREHHLVDKKRAKKAPKPGGPFGVHVRKRGTNHRGVLGYGKEKSGCLHKTGTSERGNRPGQQKSFQRRIFPGTSSHLNPATNAKRLGINKNGE